MEETEEDNRSSLLEVIRKMKTGSWQREGRQNTWQDSIRISFYFICLIWHCSERKGSKKSFLGLWFYLASESSETSRLKQSSLEGLVPSGIRTLQIFYNQAWVVSEAAQKYNCHKLVKWAAEAHVTLLFRGYIT